ncbi:MAG: ATP synthase F1 subunit epsilon [Sphingobacteriaceae bacterium]|jgi:F-type H+-transporting ATPase subunit epsilon|nr:MAG: ATP synthase F1 subunit epsilon [Pedobacter sp.]
MKLEILTPDKIVYDGPVAAVTVPGTLGTFQILPEHAPIVSTLEAGNVVVRSASKGDGIDTFLIKGGVVEVLDNKVMILVEALA